MKNRRARAKAKDGRPKDGGAKRKGDNIHQRGYECSIAHLYTSVWDQGDLEICFPLAITQMLTYLFRMRNWQRNKNLVLDPVPLKMCQSIKEAEKIITNPKRGLQAERVRQYWVGSKFVYGNGKRYTVRPLKVYEGYHEKMAALIRNFGPNGPSHPMLGQSFMGGLSNHFAARDSSKSVPFGARGPPSGRRGRRSPPLVPDHSFLIVGMHTITSNPLSISLQIKNSWGRDWGDNGCAWVTVDFILLLAGFHEADW